MADELVRVDRTGDVTTVTMTSPRQRNALSVDMMRALRDALAEAGSTDTLAVVLAAEGPVFSAGHSFRDMVGATSEDVTELFELCTSLMDTVQAMPQPVIARVHALATAAGCQLVATCDLAVAAETAGFALPGGRGGLFCHTPPTPTLASTSRTANPSARSRWRRYRPLKPAPTTTASSPLLRAFDEGDLPSRSRVEVTRRMLARVS